MKTHLSHGILIEVETGIKKGFNCWKLDLLIVIIMY